MKKYILWRRQKNAPEQIKLPLCDGCHKKIIVAKGDIIHEKSIIAELDGKKSNGCFDFIFCFQCDIDFDLIMKTIKAKGMPIHVDFIPNRFEETVPRELCPHCRYDNEVGTDPCLKCGKPIKNFLDDDKYKYDNPQDER